MKHPFPVVEITWLDAGTAHGWEGDDEVVAKPFEVQTIGFLIRDQADCVMVASTACPEKTSNGRVTIPRGMIQKLRYLSGKPKPAKTDPPPPAA
jgi:hypothetical protein